jgi:hypothetical protein
MSAVIAVQQFGSNKVREEQPQQQMEQMMEDAAWPSGAAAAGPVLLKRNTSSMNRKRTCEDNDVQAPGAWPQPKWPAGHESEAFEAVAVKKVCSSGHDA